MQTHGIPVLMGIKEIGSDRREIGHRPGKAGGVGRCPPARLELSKINAAGAGCPHLFP